MKKRSPERLLEGGIGGLALATLGYLARWMQTKSTTEVEKQRIDNERDAQDHVQLTEIIALLRTALEEDTRRLKAEIAAAEARADKEAAERRAAQEEATDVKLQLAEANSQIKVLREQIQFLRAEVQEVRAMLDRSSLDTDPDLKEES